MAIDPSIYSQIQQPRPTNRLAELAQVMQVQGLSDQVETGRREREQTDSMNALYRAAVGPDGTIDRTKLMTGAASAGLGSKLPAMQKDWAAQDKAKTDADGAQFKLAKERHDLFKSTLGALAQEPNLSKQLVMQAGQSLVSQGLLPAEMYQQAIATMPEDPQQLRQRLIQGVKAQMTPEQMFTVFAPKPEKFDTGAQIMMRDTNPNSPTYGQQTGGGAIAKEQSPDNRASVGASYANAAATREIARATRDAASIKDRRDTEMKFADDYRTQSKNFKDVVDAAKRVKAALPTADKSAAATLTAATSFMKMLDPGSVVRESELGMALAATGALDRLTNYHNVLMNGKVLTPSQIKDFDSITNKVLDAAKQGQRAVDDDYRGKAKANNLRPEMVVQELGQSGGKVVDFGSLK
jgi:hypothetical protein